LVTFVARIGTSPVGGDSETQSTCSSYRFQVDAESVGTPENLGTMDEAEPAAASRDEKMETMIHDLAGPVARVKAVAELLQSEREAIWPETAGQARNWLSIIDRASTAMEEQFQVLAEVTRAQSAAPLVPHLETMDIASLVQQIVDEFQASNRRRTFRVDCPFESLYGMWDHVLIRRVVDNLVGNAVKYTPHGGRIVVSVECEAEAGAAMRWAVLTVRDSGIGVPAADLPHVFEMFQRGSNLTSGERGVGIGLASVHAIVTQHGGDVSMTSSEAVGTAVMVRLPIVGDLPAPLPAS